MRGLPARCLAGLSVVMFLAAGLAVLPVHGGAARAATADSSVTVTKTVGRSHLINGAEVPVDSRTVTLHVSQTQNLKSLQQIAVSWSGAKPTLGVTLDQNSDFAQNEEYPFALFECRGVDSPSAPPAERLNPQTCWTQFADERFQGGYTPVPAWQSDRWSDPALRAASSNAEPAANQPAGCRIQLIGTATQRWVPFDAVDGTRYWSGPGGCAGQAPEASPENLSSSSFPSNETFGVTTAAGTGSALFDVFTGEDHASLGCSQTIPCSLVAVPVEGISCDPAGTLANAADRPDPSLVATATANCTGTGTYRPGEVISAGISASGDPAVDGQLWWSGSNWRNRISVPLTFAPPDNVCQLVGAGATENVYGSEAMAQATTQWSPHFCLNHTLVGIRHVQTPEPQARNLLRNGTVSSALSSQPPTVPFGAPTVQAPVAVSGFGIAYAVDDTTKRPLAQLNLNARLLAKLMTESYPAASFVAQAYPATAGGITSLSTNPLNITRDPEFRALNPTVPARDLDAAATLVLLNSDSDLVQALTSYINADPVAREWLNGAPDPWGMRVNPHYQGIALPVNNWPLRDSFEPLAVYQIGRIDCLAVSPVPYLPLVASPQSRLFTVAQDLEFSISPAQTNCQLGAGNDPLTGSKMVAEGRQAPGQRFLLGLVDLGDAARKALPLASLQTAGPTAGGGTFADSTGRAFVTPTPGSLRAATALLTPNQAVGTWTLDYRRFLTDPTAAAAYPGTLLINADVPTAGLTSMDAKALSALLTFAAKDGQLPGSSQGQLPDGYLPMTAANGLGAFADFTARAATAVAAQSGVVPPLVAPVAVVQPPTPPVHAPAPGTPSGITGTRPGSQPGSASGFSSGGGSSAGTAGGSTTPGTAGAGTAPVGATSTAGALPRGSAAAGGSTTPIVATAPTALSPVSATTPLVGAGLVGAVVPGLLLLGLLLAGAAVLSSRQAAAAVRVAR